MVRRENNRRALRFGHGRVHDVRNAGLHRGIDGVLVLGQLRPGRSIASVLMRRRRLAPRKASVRDAVFSKSAVRTTTPLTAHADKLSGLRVVAMMRLPGTRRVSTK